MRCVGVLYLLVGGKAEAVFIGCEDNAVALAYLSANKLHAEKIFYLLGDDMPQGTGFGSLSVFAAAYELRHRFGGKFNGDIHGKRPCSQLVKELPCKAFRLVPVQLAEYDGLINAPQHFRAEELFQLLCDLCLYALVFLSSCHFAAAEAKGAFVRQLLCADV